MRGSLISFAKIFTMRYLPVLAILLILAACGGEENKKAEPVTSRRYQAGFNQKMDTLVAHYFQLSEALVRWDTLAVTTHAGVIKSDLADLPLQEIKDSTAVVTARDILSNVSAAAGEMADTMALSEKKLQFHQLTQQLYDLLRTVQYDAGALYLQECPMALNNYASPGLWITDKGKDSIRNPYVGLHDPKYGKAMLECGENKTVLDFQKK